MHRKMLHSSNLAQNYLSMMIPEYRELAPGSAHSWLLLLAPPPSFTANSLFHFITVTFPSPPHPPPPPPPPAPWACSDLKLPIMASLQKKIIRKNIYKKIRNTK